MTDLGLIQLLQKILHPFFVCSIHFNRSDAGEVFERTAHQVF